jgi:hypothetical protein
MNLSGMNKDQKQKMILLAVAILVAVGVGLYFGITPLLNQQKQLKAELEAVKGQIAQAESLLRREKELKETFSAHHRTLSHLYREFLPTALDPLLWATERVYSPSRQVGVEIESIAERRVTTPSWSTPRQDRPPERRFAPHGVEINLRAGYETFRTYVALLEQENPYVSATQITISAQPQTPEIHRITMVLEWPRHLPGTVFPLEEKASLVPGDSEAAAPVRLPGRRET